MALGKRLRAGVAVPTDCLPRVPVPGCVTFLGCWDFAFSEFKSSKMHACPLGSVEAGPPLLVVGLCWGGDPTEVRPT